MKRKEKVNRLKQKRKKKVRELEKWLKRRETRDRDLRERLKNMSYQEKLAFLKAELEIYNG